MQIKKKDWIEVEYTGRIKDGPVFDTTSEKVAKENNIFAKGMTYAPVIICLGEGQMLQGLENQLEGKESGKEYTIELAPENAFGRKNPALLKVVPYSEFKKQNIEPAPGLQINIDGVIGTIKTSGSGRCMVDFNHPLAGRRIIYNVKINRIVTDDAEKIISLLKLEVGIKDADVKIEQGATKITLKTEIPKKAQEILGKRIIELIPQIKKVEFLTEVKKQEEKK